MLLLTAIGLADGVVGCFSYQLAHTFQEGLSGAARKSCSIENPRASIEIGGYCYFHDASDVIE
jgi:hypothetical protein